MAMIDKCQHITPDESWEFIREKLKIDQPKAAMERDKLQLLNSIIEGYHSVIPFHNLDIVSKHQSKRTVPSVEENVDSVLKGFGGMCWTSNSAMLCVLRSIGYDVFMITTNIAVPDNHVCLVAKNVCCQGDAYLVEFGLGEPSFHAMALNFETETEVVHESFRSYKLVREGDMYKRLVRTRVPRKPGENPWKIQYTFKTKPCDLETAKNFMQEKIYRNSKSVFSQGLRLIRFRENKLFCIKDNLLLVENSNHQLKSISLETDEELLSTMLLHFPKIPVDMATYAVALWRENSGKEKKRQTENKIQHLLVDFST